MWWWVGVRLTLEETLARGPQGGLGDRMGVSFLLVCYSIKLVSALLKVNLFFLYILAPLAPFPISLSPHYHTYFSNARTGPLLLPHALHPPQPRRMPQAPRCVLRLCLSPLPTRQQGKFAIALSSLPPSLPLLILALSFGQGLSLVFLGRRLEAAAEDNHTLGTLCMCRYGSKKGRGWVSRSAETEIEPPDTI